MINRRISIAVVALALITGWASDFSLPHEPTYIGGYRVLTADLHVHTFPLSASTLAPWDVVMDARRQGLDVIAISGHNETISGKVGRWFSRKIGGPLVLASQEIHGPAFHMVAVGIHSTISWRLTASHAIDEIHRQGGVAIAAHPAESGAAYLAGGAIDKLDGAEVFQPLSFNGPAYAREMREFYTRSRAAAIASSDYHGMGRLGLCRTLIFVKDVSEQGVLEAIRARRTVVFDGKQVYGDPELSLQVLHQSGGSGPITEPPSPPTQAGLFGLISAIWGILGMIGLVFSYRRTMK